MPGIKRLLPRKTKKELNETRSIRLATSKEDRKRAKRLTRKAAGRLQKAKTQARKAAG